MRHAARTADHVDGQAGDAGADAGRPANTGPAGQRGAAGGRLSQLPYLSVLAGVAAGLAVIRQGSTPMAVRHGTLIIGAALMVGALARLLLLPGPRAGLLAVRTRRWDVVALAALGAGLLAAGFIYPMPG